MAIGSIPPWLEINPRDFLAATREGAQAGLAIAHLRQAAQEAAAAREQRASEFAASQAERSQEVGARAREAENQMALRQFEHQQAIQMRVQQLAQEREKSREAIQAATQYHLATLGLRNAAMEKAKSDAEERNRHNLAIEAASAQRLAPKDASDLVTTNKDGENFYWNGRGWTHIPKSKSGPPENTPAHKLAVYKTLATEHAQEPKGTPQWQANEERLNALRQEALGTAPIPPPDLKSESGPGLMQRAGDLLFGAPAPISPVAPGTQFSPDMQPGAFGPTGEQPAAIPTPSAAISLQPTANPLATAGTATAPAMPTFPAAPTKATPESRMARAKQLREQYPDWEKQDIIDAVNQEMP